MFTISQIVRGAFQSAYLGYYGHARYANQGYMRAALELVLDHAFGPLALHRIEANIQPGNEPSIALARGAGFRLEGFSPRYLLIGGRWRDHERYAITAEERAGNGRTPRAQNSAELRSSRPTLGLARGSASRRRAPARAPRARRSTSSGCSGGSQRQQLRDAREVRPQRRPAATRV